MTKKDYVLIAQKLKEGYTEYFRSDDWYMGYDAAILHISTALRIDNSNFDTKEFLEAIYKDIVIKLILPYNYNKSLVYLPTANMKYIFCNLNIYSELVKSSVIYRMLKLNYIGIAYKNIEYWEIDVKSILYARNLNMDFNPYLNIIEHVKKCKLQNNFKCIYNVVCS